VRYSEMLLHHFRHPRNAGMMRDPDGVGEAEFRECRDVARFYLRVIEGRVVEARFQAYGCGPTIAAASAATELATGVTIDRVRRLEAAQVEAALGGLPAERRHASEVVSAAMRAAADDARRRAAGLEVPGRAVTGEG
jgi:NifU-like protein involved in Fe-S cluster formation